jgi:hypothetical protein
VQVTFDCAGTRCTLSAGATHVVQQKLRAIGEGRILGFSVDQGLMAGATAVADLIDEVQYGRWDEPIPLAGHAADAVYQATRLCTFSAVDHLSAAALLQVLHSQRSAPAG